MGKDRILLVNLSGRGDKDMNTVAERYAARSTFLRAVARVLGRPVARARTASRALRNR